MRSYKIKALLSSLPAIIHKLWEIVWGNCPPPCLPPSVHHRCLILLKFCCNKLKNSRIVVAPEFPKVGGGGAVIIGENLCGGYLDMEVSGENYTVNWYIFIEFSYGGGGGTSLDNWILQGGKKSRDFWNGHWTENSGTLIWEKCDVNMRIYLLISVALKLFFEFNFWI